MRLDPKWVYAWLLAVGSFIGANAYAQTNVPYEEVHTVADNAHAVPVEHSFDISVAGNYQIALTDLGAALTPSAPVASLKLVLTKGADVVGQPLLTAGTMQFTADV